MSSSNSTMSVNSPTLSATSPVSFSSANPPSSAASQPASSNAPSSSSGGPTSGPVVSSFVTISPSSTGPVTVFQTITSQGTTITQNVPVSNTNSASSVSSSSSAPLNGTTTNNGSQGNSQSGIIAAAVVVPVVVIALLIVGAIFFWKKRKQRKEAEESRRKEMEEYSYNPNNDPTIPAVGTAVSDGQEPAGGYRGWGTTTSATRKASTTLSSGMARSNSGGDGYHGQYSPNNTNSEQHSGDPLMDGNGAHAEPVGALGGAPVSGNKSAGGVNRGPSNASSAYSNGANRSDTSGEGPSPMSVGSPQYYNDLMYQDVGMPHDHADNSWGGQPVIKDVSARRNTRIENPSVFPQQGNAGISQNF